MGDFISALGEGFNALMNLLAIIFVVAVVLLLADVVLFIMWLTGYMQVHFGQVPTW